MRSGGRGGTDIVNENRRNNKKKGNNKEEQEKKISEEEIFGQICKGVKNVKILMTHVNVHQR